MFMQRFKQWLCSKRNDTTEKDTRILALEKEVAERKNLVTAQNQKEPVAVVKSAELSPKPALQKPVEQKEETPAKAVCFDMVEYFCNGHDDVTVAVSQFDSNGKKIAEEEFNWNTCDEVTSEGLWRKAKEYARELQAANIPLRWEKPLCGEDRNHMQSSAERKETSKQPTKEEIQSYQAIMQQPLGPFFCKDEPVLLHSVGSWEQDVEEACRRMDLFFSTAEAFRWARREKQCKGEFRFKGNYDCTFWAQEYFHSHDGWDVRGESATIRRISPKEFYNPSDSSNAEAYRLALEGKQKNSIYLNGWGEISFDQLWKVPEELEEPEEERYYLRYNRFCAKNFLGMVGYFEICWESF